jgi:hypothetical protein
MDVKGSKALAERIAQEYEEVTLPGTGEIVSLSDESACALALNALRDFENQIREAKRLLTYGIVERTKVLGSKSFTLSGGKLKAEVRGGPERAYDAEAIERELREAGMPEARIRQIVREEITYTLRAVEAKRAAGANEEYAAIIERNATEVEKPYTVTIRRT